MEKFKKRFFARVKQTASCWIWIGNIDSDGYGRLKDNQTDRWRAAHRIAWELLRGPIPPNLTIDHLCFVKCCVNPDHLEPCTSEENTRRYYEAHVRKRPRGHFPCDPCKHGQPWAIKCSACQHEVYLRRTEGKVLRRNTSYGKKRASHLAQKQAHDQGSTADRDSI